MARDAVYPSELIGKKVTIIASANHSLIGLTGLIVDETRSTLVLESAHRRKVILKKGVTLRFGDTGRVILGVSLVKKPEERLKG